MTAPPHTCPRQAGLRAAPDRHRGQWAQSSPSLTNTRRLPARTARRRPLMAASRRAAAAIRRATMVPSCGRRRVDADVATPTWRRRRGDVRALAMGRKVLFYSHCAPKWQRPPFNKSVDIAAAALAVALPPPARRLLGLAAKHEAPAGQAASASARAATTDASSCASCARGNDADGLAVAAGRHRSCRCLRRKSRPLCREAPQVLKSRLLAIVLLQGYAPRLGCRRRAAGGGNGAETVGTVAAAAAVEAAAVAEAAVRQPSDRFPPNQLRPQVPSAKGATGRSRLRHVSYTTAVAPRVPWVPTTRGPF